MPGLVQALGGGELPATCSEPYADVALALINVVQVVGLAYVAAVVTRGRNVTRADDPPGTEVQ